ncbi:MAG: LacI family DNA-binding transcriptional regulator [Thermoleophilia bacterium]
MSEGNAATPPPTRRPTVRDVARAAGVSVAVVSYSFNRPDRVAGPTRERVLATAAAIGYRGPDPAARALRLGRHGAVALVGAGQVEELLTDPAAALVARGLARACDLAGIALVLSGGREAGVDGTVLLRDASVERRPGSRIVVVDGDAPEGVPRVLAHVEEGAAAAAAHLAARGARRLAVLGWPGAGPRLDGARRGWGETGPVHALISPDTRRATGEVAARAALRAEPRPDAILGLADGLALGALDAAHHIGLAVPGDLLVAGIDDLPGSDLVGLTTVFVPYRPMGELAGGMLAALIEGDEVEPPPPLPTSLAIRRSTG